MRYYYMVVYVFERVTARVFVDTKKPLVSEERIQEIEAPLTERNPEARSLIITNIILLRKTWCRWG